MKRLLIVTMPVVIAVLLFSCGPKNKPSADHSVKTDQRQQPAETIFGIYKFGKSGKIAIILKEDSTAVMDKPDKSNNSLAPGKGNFTFRNDSIFITWDNGRQVNSKFERGGGIYSFRIGSTSYKRKL